MTGEILFRADTISKTFGGLKAVDNVSFALRAGIITALVPVLGYATATVIARGALASGRGVYELVMERGLLTREQLDQALNPEAMTAPRAVTGTAKSKTDRALKR